MNEFITVRKMSCSSRFKKTASCPVSGVPGIPDGVGAKEGQFAAVLRHAADLVHLQAMAQLGEDGSVPRVHNTPGPDFKWDVGAPEAIALDGGGELLVSLSLPRSCSLDVGGRVPRHSELDELYLLCLPVDDDQVRLLSRHGHVGRDGDAVHRMLLLNICTR